MSEPVTLYKGSETVTVVAPSEAQRLIAEGWTHEQGQRQEGQDAQGKQREEIEGEKERQAVEPDPQFAVSASLMDTLVTEVTPKRGRPAKGQ